MKVLFISSSSGSRGGGELYLLFLAEAFCKEGVEVALWCSTHSRMDELADSFSRFGKVFRAAYRNTYDYKIRSIRYLFSKKRIESVGKAIADFGADIIHVNKQNIEDGLDLLETLDDLKVPYVTTIHITQTQKSLGALLGGYRDAVSRKILQRASSLKWITISSSRAHDFAVFLRDKDKIIMIPNGVEIEKDEHGLRQEMRKKLAVPESNLVLISVGRLEQQKNPLKFIDWAEQCLRLNSNLNFYWIGDGSMRNGFEEKINSLQLNHCIRCLGWQKEVKPFYAMADVYLHTASFEGMPFSLLEAMSWKLPCAVSEELHEDLSFPEGVIYKDFEGLKLFITNRETRLKAGDDAYDYLKRNFSLEVITKSYLSMYKPFLVNIGKE